MSITDRNWARLASGLALLVIAALAGINYPGNYTFDTVDQLHQATTGLFNDWHPPLMAYVWRILISLTGQQSSLFLFQHFIYWGAFGLIANALIRIGNRKIGFFVFLVGLFPVFIYINGLVVKDSQMGASFLASFAIIFWFKVQKLRIPVTLGILAALLLTYGTLVRSNSVFALGPLLIYFFSGKYHFRYAKTILLTLPIALAGIFLSVIVNSTIPGLAKTQPIRSLQIFDLIGIARYSGDVAALSEITPLTHAEITRCYTAYWWDSVSPWGTCPAFSAKFMNKEYKEILSDRDVYPLSSKLTPMWISAITHHPAAYVQHRIRHFNAELNFIVPALERRYGKTFFTADEAEIRKDYAKKNFSTWPVFWYFISILVLTALRHTSLNSRNHAAILLACSGLTYGFAYLIIGVASDSRYMYWTMLTSFIGLVLVFDQIYLRLKNRDTPTLLALFAIVGCIILGLAARLGNWQFMLA